jgi:hypothetical protein
MARVQTNFRNTLVARKKLLPSVLNIYMLALQNHQDPNLEKHERKTDLEWRRLSNQVIYFISKRKVVAQIKDLMR